MLRAVAGMLVPPALAAFVIACGGREASDFAPPASAPEPDAPLYSPVSEAARPPVSDDPALPRVVRLLSPEYQEAYRLLPDGPWARRYYAEVFDPDQFEWKEWKSGIAYQPPASTPEPQLGPGLEFQLQIVLRDEDERGWLIERIRELDPAAAEAFALAESEAERIDVFRQMLTEPGIDERALQFEVVSVWQARTAGVDQGTIVRPSALDRVYYDTQRTFTRLWVEQGYNASALYNTEINICNHLMWDVLGRHDLPVVMSEGICDLEKLTQIVRAALRDGETARSEDEFREWLRKKPETSTP